MKTLVIITHSFRLDSRLTASLNDEISFLYYSPYYFANSTEKNILANTSKLNLDCFYWSINTFKEDLQKNGFDLIIRKSANPIDDINEICNKFNFDNIVIDQPLFAFWKSFDVTKLEYPYKIVDSDTVQDTCLNRTAKSRWLSHIKTLDTEKQYRFTKTAKYFDLNLQSESYPIVEIPTKLLSERYLIERLIKIAPTYGQTRDKHDGQTSLSTALQNGTIDPHNIFYFTAKLFDIKDRTVNEGIHASMLRQFAFREMNIMSARTRCLSMESSIEDWTSILTISAFNNLQEQVNANSNITWKNLKTSSTPFKLVNTILTNFYETGIMPNRARMYIIGKLFYESPTGIDGLKWCIALFNLYGIDGQSPNNYMQCVSSLGLSYGKVMLLNQNNVENLLSYNN